MVSSSTWRPTTTMHLIKKGGWLQALPFGLLKANLNLLLLDLQTHHFLELNRNSLSSGLYLSPYLTNQAGCFAAHIHHCSGRFTEISIVNNKGVSCFDSIALCINSGKNCLTWSSSNENPEKTFPWRLRALKKYLASGDICGRTQKEGCSGH